MTITGTVTEETGAALPGASVAVKGTTIGTLTGGDGSYSIRASRNSVLVFSFVGMEPLEVPVANQSTINVTLRTQMVGLDELVVIGYGTQSRKTITTAITQVGSEKIEEVPLPNVTRALQGKISGVRILQTTGQPGKEASVVIRGGSSISKSSDPLYLVDGFPREINDINPRDIASIEVLKDAAATSIYGARASNGVILITTKSGEKGTSNIDFTVTTGFQEFGRKIETITAEEYLLLYRPAIENASSANKNYLTGPTATGINTDISTWTTRFLAEGEEVPEGWHTTVDPVTGNTLVFQDNDLQEQLFQRAMQVNYYLSASGGTDKITYFTGVGYTKQEGVAVGTQYDRWTVRNNIKYAVNDKISLTSNYDHSFSRTNQFENEANLFTRGAFNAKTIRDYFPDGTPGWGNNATLANPLWVNYTRINDRTFQRSTIGLSGDWEIIPNLHFRPSGNYYTEHYTRDYFEKLHNFNTQRPGEAERDQSQRWQYEMLLTYDLKKIGKHDLSVLAGYSNLYIEDQDVSAEAYGAPTDNIPTLNVSPVPTSAFSSFSEERLISYFGRLLYNYDDKYLLTASIRNDGSSRFGAENKFALFPSFSAGWIVSGEPFMSGVDNLISFLKVRATYGQTGNNDIGRYASQGTYAATFPYGGSAGIRATAMPNLALRWEKTTQYDVGFDLHLFPKENIEMSFDYYYKRSDDLLFSKQLPRETGFNSVEMNIGSVAYNGFEFLVSTKNIRTKNFSWITDFNIAYNTNKVLELPDREGIDKNRVNGIIFPDGTGVGGIAEGEKLNSIIGWQVAFLIDNDEQASAALYDERAAGYDPITKKATKGKKFPGDFEWVENWEDGKISDLDQFVLGYEVPHTTGGMTNTFAFKGIQLNIFTDFAIGHSICDMARAWLNGVGARQVQPTTDVLDAWKEPGDAARTMQPKILFHDPSAQQNHTRNNSYYTYRADFICIREVTLGYDIPERITSRVGLKRVKTYVAGNNLHYFTKYPGFSPEVGGEIRHNGGKYPTFRTVVFGLNIGL
ncbi:MAG: TonB-dependent receptor [Bacteroidales bacterium]|nr:TonB-dependent receptor [Bacteroidales bacterium]